MILLSAYTKFIDYRQRETLILPHLHGILAAVATFVHVVRITYSYIDKSVQCTDLEIVRVRACVSARASALHFLCIYSVYLFIIFVHLFVV